MKNKLVFRVCATAILLAALQGASFADSVVECASIRPIVSASVVPLGVQPYAENEVTYSIDSAPAVTASLADAIAAINVSPDGTSAHIELNADIQVSQTYTLTGNKTVTIDGTANGYSLTRKKGYLGALIAVESGSLELTNVTMDGNVSVNVEDEFSWSWYGTFAEKPLIEARNATLILSSNTVLQNARNAQLNAQNNGGAISLDNASLTIKDGAEIQKCSANNNGGAIYATGSGSIVTLEETSISYCDAKNGGAVFLENGARLVANGRTTSDVRIFTNHATNGGAIYATGSVSTAHSLNLISIQGNRAQYGGAVYAVDGAKFQSNSANHDIIENTAAKNGGAFYIEGADSEVNLTLTSLQRNEAQNGGAVYVSGSGKFIADTVQMKANQATNDGGAVYANTGATVSLKRGTGGYENPEPVNSGVLQNIAGRNGGGIYAADAGTQITIGERSTVGIYDNEAGNMAGAIYLQNGAVAMLTNSVDIRRNNGAEKGAPTTPWKEELSCGGVRVDETSTLKLAGTITITENTVGTAEREVNLLIDSDKVAAGNGQNVPVECYWDYGGLESGTEIGVSLKVWPMKSGSTDVLYMIGKTYTPSSNGIDTSYTGYFTSDRNPYDSTSGEGIFETVVSSAPHPDIDTPYNQVYLKAYPIETPTVSADGVNKYYDASNKASLTNVKWSNVDSVVQALFEGLKEGTDYTYIAAFANNTQGNVLFDAASVKEQTVNVTLLVKNKDILEVFPSLASITFTSKATIYPIPLAATAQVQDKYYDAANTAQATVSLAVDKTAAAQAGLTLPNALPLTPVLDTDYTVTASFDSANAGAGKTAAVQVASKDTALAKNYIWPSAAVTASAEILKLPLEISFEAGNKVYDGSASAVLKGTPTVNIAQQSRSRLTLPSSLPETVTFGTDYTLENLMFVDTNGQPVSDAGTHNVTGTLKSLNDSKMNNYTMTLAAQGAQAEITQRTLTPVSVKVQDKLYDGTTEAAASDLVFSGLPDGVTLEEGVDYRIVSAVFEDAETGIDKQVRVTFELLSEQAKKNYVLEKDFLLAEADITNDLKVTDEHTEEVSSGVMTAQDIEAWIRAEYYNVPTTLVSLSIKDADGNEVQEIDRSVVAVYSIEALFNDGQGQTAFYQIVWNLVEKQVETPTVPEETPSTPEETPSTPEETPSTPQETPTTPQETPTQSAVASPIVQTGDNSPTELFALAFAISGTAIAVLLIVGRKRNNIEHK